MGASKWSLCSAVDTQMNQSEFEIPIRPESGSKCGEGTPKLKTFWTAGSPGKVVGFGLLHFQRLEIELLILK